jgi:hypothetical protein
MRVVSRECRGLHAPPPEQGACRECAGCARPRRRTRGVGGARTSAGSGLASTPRSPTLRVARAIVRVRARPRPARSRAG